MVMAEGQWSLEIEKAWANLFRMIVLQMRRAYADLEEVVNWSYYHTILCILKPQNLKTLKP